MPGLGASYPELDSRDIVADFFPAFEEELSNQWGTQVSMEVESDRETETFKWPGAASGMREWEGGRNLEVLKMFSMTITNADYESTMAMKLRDLRRDKTALLRRRIQEQARKAAQHWNKLLTTTIESNPNAYDGKSFFSSSHDESGSNQSNDLGNTAIPAANVGTVAAPTVEEAADIINQVTGYFYTLKDDQGDPVNGQLGAIQIQVSTQQHWAAFYNAVRKDRLSGGEQNTIPGNGIDYEVIFNTRLTGTSSDKIYFFITDGLLAPFIRQEEVPLTEELLGEGSDHEFHHKEHLFGLSATRAVGPGRWHHAIRLTLS